MKISDNKLQAKIKWTPHAAQQKILDEAKRDVVICAGRRFGKSAVCAYVALKTLLQPNKKIWIVAPTYDLTLKVFDYLLKWYMMAAPVDGRNRWLRGIQNRPFPQIKTPWGSILQCKSAENKDGLLGEELDLLIIDECSRIQRKVYETYLFATTASRKGSTFFISTPFGKNWFYEKWVAAKAHIDGAAFIFKSKDNPNLPEGEWERAKEMLPQQTFEQEYEAAFLSDAASVFRGVHDIIGPTLAEPKKGHTYVMGVDLARHLDYTVLTVIDKSTFPHEVVAFDRFKDIDYPLQKTRIKNLADKYGARLVVDSTAVGAPISTDLKREGLLVEDFTFSKKSKPELIEKLSIYIEQRKIAIPDIETLIDELGAFGYEMTPAGNITYGAPTGLHDDCVISLALAVWPLRGTKVTPAEVLTFPHQNY